MGFLPKTEKAAFGREKAGKGTKKTIDRFFDQGIQAGKKIKKGVRQFSRPPEF
jgi:hypothetical protein